MLTISSRQFRDNQKSYLDKVAKGMEILITRKNEVFKLVPVVEDDTLMTKQEFFAQLEQAMQELKEGKTRTYDPKKGLNSFLNSLDECTE